MKCAANLHIIYIIYFILSLDSDDQTNSHLPSFHDSKLSHSDYIYVRIHVQYKYNYVLWPSFDGGRGAHQHSTNEQGSWKICFVFSADITSIIVILIIVFNL